MSGRIWISCSRRSISSRRRRPSFEALLGSHHAARLVHRVADGTLDRAGELVPAAGEDVVDLLAGGADRRVVADLALGLAHQLGGRRAGDLAEHHAIDERVAAEAVGAVESSRALADREESFHVGLVLHSVDEHAAHGVVGRRCDLHRGAGDVEHREIDEVAVDLRQLAEDLLAAEVRHVEVDRIALGAAAFDDLRVVGQRHAVASRQLHPHRVVALHVALALGVAEDAALAAHRLGDELTRRLLGIDHAAGVELDQLHVAQPAACVEREPHRVAVVLVAARRAAPVDPHVPAGGEDDGIGVHDHPAPGVHVEPVGAEDPPVVYEEPGDVEAVVEGDAQLLCAAQKGAVHLTARVIAGVTGSPVPVGAEEALQDLPVLVAREVGSPPQEILDAARRLTRERLDEIGLVEPVALLERVGGVRLPRVLGVHRPQGGVDAALCQHGMRVAARSLGRAEDAHALLGQLDRRPQARASRTDDQDVRRDALLRRASPATARSRDVKHRRVLPQPGRGPKPGAGG